MRQDPSQQLHPAETQELITSLQKEEGAYVRFTLDSHGCLRSLFWATAEQVRRVRRQRVCAPQLATCAARVADDQRLC
jgi:phage-related protein